MDINDELVDQVEEALEEQSNFEYTTDDGEVQFIRDTIDAFDNISEHDGSQEISTKVKKMHSTPEVTFCWPYINDSPRAEFADLLFMANFYEDNTLVEKRAMISQSKFTPKNARENKNKKWKIQMNQFMILHELPKFKVTSPGTGEIFQLDSETRMFTNYSFASNFLKPFYYSTENFVDDINTGAKKPTLNLEHKSMNGYNSSKSIIKRFLKRKIGEEVTENAELIRFLQHIYENSDSFGRSETENVVATDGGEQELPPGPEAGAIQINIGELDEFESLDEAIERSEGSTTF
ncbi:hypothetical protein [Halorussus ruber]|uniref:hypothetical protein n=1 Tax=Halorussus ruber TaxID=1126238 RepID=UPI001092A78C|nr:hypothetical protein [Halorussus ruber]